jgi:hypothetical protein
MISAAASAGTIVVRRHFFIFILRMQKIAFQGD